MVRNACRDVESRVNRGGYSRTAQDHAEQVIRDCRIVGVGSAGRAVARQVRVNLGKRTPTLVCASKRDCVRGGFQALPQSGALYDEHGVPVRSEPQAPGGDAVSPLNSAPRHVSPVSSKLSPELRVNLSEPHRQPLAAPVLSR